MKKINRRILVNDMSRLFIRRSDCDCYIYQNCYGISNLSQSRSEPTKVECNDGAGDFEEVGVILGSLSRVTTELTTYDTLLYENALDDIFLDNCPLDIQVHFGECDFPSNFNSYDKVIVLNDVYPTTFDKSQLLALTSGERSAITTTLGISAKEFYTIYPVTYAASIQPTVGPLVSLATQCPGSCPTCPCSITGKTTVLALQIRDDPDNIDEADLWLLYSFDGGITFEEIKILCFRINHDQDANCDGIVFLESPNIRLVGNQIIITVSPGQSIVYDLGDLYRNDELTQLSYSGQLGTFDFAVYDSATCDGYTYAVGQNGNAWRVNNTTGVSNRISLDLHTTSDLYSVACNGDDIIIGGESGVWIGTGSNVTFSATSPTNVLNVDITDGRHLAATANNVFFSCDCGSTWTRKWAVPSGYCLKDIDFYNQDVGFAILNNTTVGIGPAIYKTIDGGCTFTRIERVILPENYILYEIEACKLNQFYAVGFEIDAPIPADPCNPDEQWLQLSTGTNYTPILITSQSIF